MACSLWTDCVLAAVSVWVSDFYWWCDTKVLSSETIPSSIDLIDPNLRNLVDEVAVKVKAHLCTGHNWWCM